MTFYREKDQTLCPKCGRMYCEGYWDEGVCSSDMHFCGEPTADGDAVADYVRRWYEIHRETWWDRSKLNARYGRPWERGLADEFMLALINEVARIEGEAKSQIAKRKS